MSMNIVDIPGRHELVLTRRDGPRVVFWHTTPDAHVLAVVHALNPGDPLTEVPTEIYRELFRESLEYILQRVPRPS
jgi:hypothetical protein